nr:hypothetical protein [Helcococcus sueciensis]
MEIALTEDLFANPLHPYTQSLLQSVPIPDPIIEKQKEVHVYDSSIAGEYTENHQLREVAPHHYVFCTPEEVEMYKAKLK